jgi:hypothetical protein
MKTKLAGEERPEMRQPKKEGRIPPGGEATPRKEKGAI